MTEEQSETGVVAPAEQEIQDESITRLKALRGANRGVLTRLENETLKLIAKSEDGEEINLGRLMTIDRFLDEKREVVSSYNATISEKINVEEIEREVDEATEIELRMGETRTMIKNFLKKDRKLTRTQYVPIEHASGYVLHGSPYSSLLRQRSQVSANPKLPKINLKRFNGDITKFYTFWESFESAVHNNEELSAVDKFNYLHSLLDGAAASSVQGLPFKADSHVAGNRIRTRTVERPRIFSWQFLLEPSEDQMHKCSERSRHDRMSYQNDASLAFATMW